MNTRVPEDQKCEVCQNSWAFVLVDLNTDSEYQPVLWWACKPCADKLQSTKGN